MNAMAMLGFMVFSPTYGVGSRCACCEEGRVGWAEQSEAQHDAHDKNANPSHNNNPRQINALRLVMNAMAMLGFMVFSPTYGISEEKLIPPLKFPGSSPIKGL